MSEPKHTPGPWERRLIADELMIVGPSIAGQRHIVAELKHNPEANGDLIALAPQMLEVLKKARWLRSIDNAICLSRTASAHKRYELRKEAERIEDEIFAVVTEAEGGCEPSAKNPQSEPPLVKVGLGSKVRIKKNGREGIVRTIWNSGGGETQYSVRHVDAAERLAEYWLAEKDIELIENPT